MNSKPYTIVEIAKMLGVSNSTLRKYEEDYGLHITRNGLGNREYTQEDLDVLQIICDLKKEGHNIYTIRRVLNKNPEALEHREKNLEALTVSDMKGNELIMLMQKVLSASIQDQHEQHKSEIAAMQEQHRKDIDSLIGQQQAENQKLMGYIQQTREQNNKNGFFQRLFKK